MSCLYGADTKWQVVTMLQVPAAVAKVWQGQTRDAIRNNRQVLIGTLETSSVGGKRVLELANSASLESERIPKHYKVEEAGAGNTVTTFLFSSKKDAGVSVFSIPDPYHYLQVVHSM
jgi:hypothetical protein